MECPLGQDIALFGKKIMCICACYRHFMYLCVSIDVIFSNAAETVLVGSDEVSSLRLRGNISCGACEAGQKQLSRIIGTVGTWWCDKCPPLTYIIDKMGPCHNCPKGADCPDGTQFVPKVDGSKWEQTIAKDGLLYYRVVQCPAGYSFYREEDFPINDNCIRCEKSTYTVEVRNSLTISITNSDMRFAICS